MTWDATGLAHVTTGDLATASVQNKVLDDIALLKTTINDDGTLSGAGLITAYFDGLQLRTHPDASVALSQLEATWRLIVMDTDGTKYATPTTPLTADITASGAGGLDTGAEAASTWYEVYAIGKTSTKALADVQLLLHKAKKWILDQFDTVNATSEKLRQGASDRVKLAQGIKTTNTGPLEAVDLLVARVGSPTGNIWLTIETDNAGSPSGSVQATSDKINIANINTAAQALRFVFRTPFTPTAATQYHIVLQGDFSVSTSNYLNWFGDTANSYANGVAKKFDGTSWAAATPLDFWFKAYVTSTTAVTMPPNYNQKCKIGYVYNDGSSNFVQFLAINREVTLQQQATAALTGLNNANSGITDCVALLPPAPCIVHCVGYDTGGATTLFVAGSPDGYALQVGLGILSNIRLGGSSGGAVIAGANQPLQVGFCVTDTPGLYFAATGIASSFFIGGYEWLS
jgi:hypothetical protein